MMYKQMPMWLVLAFIATIAMLGAVSSRWPAANLGLDLDRDGIADCWDWDGNQKCELAMPWDADGDGSSCPVTCTAENDPFPQCRFAGELICPDAADDIACMRPALNGDPLCGNTYTMEQGGTIKLRSGIRYIIFSCWDIGDWVAACASGGDDCTSAPPTETDVNDPRDSTRRDTTGDTDVLADCPQDENGVSMVGIPLGWSDIKIEGGGMDLRKAQEISATEPLVGSQFTNDLGHYLKNWFGNSSAAVLALGNNLIASSACSAPSSTSCGNLRGSYANHSAFGGKGWGSLTDALDWADNTMSVCVCDDKEGTDCGTIPAGATAAIASADNWVSTLSDGDIGLLSLSARGSTADTRKVTLMVTIDGSGFEQTGCTDTGAKKVKLGWTTISGQSNFDQGLGWVQDAVDCNADSNCGLYVLNPMMHQSQITIEKLGFGMQDPPNDSVNDCSATGTLDPQATYSDDEDCDTLFQVMIRTGGDNILRDLGFVEWGVFAIDGSSTNSRNWLERLTFIHGSASSLMDPGGMWFIRQLRLLHSHLKHRLMSSIGVSMDVNDVLIEDSSFESSMWMWGYQRHISVSNVYATSVGVNGPAFEFGCGVNGSSFRNFYLSGKKGYISLSLRPMLSLNCTSGTEQIRGNLFENWLADPDSSNMRYMVYLDDGSEDKAGANRIIGNTFMGFRNEDENNAIFACCDDCADPYTAGSCVCENVLEKNTFIGAWRTSPGGSPDDVFCEGWGGLCNSIGTAESGQLPVTPNQLGIIDDATIYRTHLTVADSSTEAIAATTASTNTCDTACRALAAQGDCVDSLTWGASTGAGLTCASANNEFKVCGCVRGSP